MIYHLVDPLFPARASVPLCAPSDTHFEFISRDPNKLLPPLGYAVHANRLLAYSTKKCEAIADVPLAVRCSLSLSLSHFL
jgi:hypothetical protein